MDYMEFDTAPSEEKCASVGEDNYYIKAKMEYDALVNQIKQIFGLVPETVSFRFKGCPHDFGTYYQLMIKYDENNEAAEEYIYKIENEFPKFWDKEAKRQLTTNGYYGNN
jgi:hypothetical protein